MGLEPEDVRNFVRENKIKFIRLQFTDIFGILKNVAITAAQLDKALKGELMFDGSSIEGFVRIEESDMYLLPDPSTFVVFPWQSEEEKTARLICDVYDASGQPFVGCPRCNLKKILREAAAKGFTMKVGPEAEFFLFHTDAEGKPTLITHDDAGYFDLAPVDRGESARRDITLALQEMGFEVEASHHEVAPGQHEIDFKYADALEIADRIATFKFVVRTIAQKHGLHATFMPKPLVGVPGSGMHLHFSLHQKEINAFYDSQGEHQLSKTALYFLGGLLAHAPALTAIVNPTVNSYKRLVSGFEAPVYIAWSERNRSPLVRIPAKKGPSTRLEFRSPDPACNPYLALAVCLKAGLDGIERKILPPPPCNQNIYQLSPLEREALGIKSLPASLAEALTALEKDEAIQSALGEHIYERFREAKKIEWEHYQVQVHPWELREYLTKF